MRIRQIFAASVIALSLNACNRYSDAEESIPYTQAIDCAAVASLKIQENEQLFDAPDIDQAALVHYNEIVWAWRGNAERDAAFKGRDQGIAVTDIFHKETEKAALLQDNDKEIDRLSGICARAYLPESLYSQFKSYKLHP